MFRPANLSLIMGLLFTSAVLAQTTDVAEPYPIQEANLNLTEADEGGAFELQRISDQLVVVLEGNPTTGYMWEVEGVDESILQQIDDADFLPDSDALGAGGKLVLHFRAMSMGQTTLRLVYHRPWEEDVEPLKTFTVNVAVRSGEVPAEDSMSYEEWLVHYGDDLNDDGRADEADYELWKENPYIGIPISTAVSTQSWGAIKEAVSR